jgi:putative selenate reductase
MEKYHAEVKCGAPAPSVAELKKQGLHPHLLCRTGAWKAGRLDIPGNVVPVIGWLKDLKAGQGPPWAMWPWSAAATPPWTPPAPR